MCSTRTLLCFDDGTYEVLLKKRRHRSMITDMMHGETENYRSKLHPRL